MKYAKRISPAFVKQYEHVIPPWGPVGYVTYKRTYSRRRESGYTEEFYQTLERCCNGILDIGGAFTRQEIESLYDHCFHLRGIFSGRALWQLGSPTVQRVGADSLQSCWYVNVNSPIDPFIFTFNQLMLGGGVGFGVSPQHVYELPIVKFRPKVIRTDSPDCDFIVPDNREGWVELLKRILKAFFFTGRDLRYYTKCIRERGRLIGSFGGTASGPESLVQGLDQIVTILMSRYLKKLRPIDCLDIMNIIGSIVVAGNVRRSAEIAIGDAQDLDFIRAKDWSLYPIPDWRRMSNNTVDCDNIYSLPSDFWRGYAGNGEAYGLINLNLCKKKGRLADNHRSDPYVLGVNPCGEITLENKECCNLGEIYLSNIRNANEFFEVASLLYKAQKTISCVPFSDKETQEVVNRNHRLGIGVTGVAQARHLYQASVFDSVYRGLEELDVKYSKLLNTTPSNKLTTVKPSGTLSKLAGCTPGANAGYAEYFIQRIQFSANDPLVDILRQNGYPVEPLLRLDGSHNLETMVVSFPSSTPSNAIMAKNIGVIDQLEMQKFLQTHWSDNAVSLTAYYQKSELPELQAWLEENFNDSVKTTSFLLHSDHGFAQAPMEEITRDQFLELTAKVKPITTNRDEQVREILNDECASGACPAR